MKAKHRIPLLLVLTLLCGSGWTAEQKAPWRTYQGAWFTVKYPPGFTVRPSLRSKTAGGYDSAFFISPDKKVQFYVFSPQWDGNPSDAALVPSKEKITSRVIKRDRYGQTLTWLTIRARNGSYTRSLYQVRNEYGRVNLALSIRYADARAYSAARDLYKRFKSSLVQYAD